MKQIALGLLFLFAIPFFAHAANIDATNKYARFLNTGTLINFGATNGNVTVTNTAVTGYAWSTAAGWINLAPSNGGVVNDGNGVLSGYAWGENTGWINFKPTAGGVTIDSSGNFSGYAWSETRGWIVFNCATDSTCGALSHKVQTSWVPTASAATGSLGGSWVNTVNSQNPQPVPQSPIQNPEPTPVVPSESNTQTPSTPAQNPSSVPESTTPSQEPSTSLTPDGTPNSNPGESRDVPVNEPTTGANTEASAPTFQDKVFGFASTVSDAASRALSSIKDSAVKGMQKIKIALATPIVGDVTVLNLLITAGMGVLALFVLLRIRLLLLGVFLMVSKLLFSFFSRVITLVTIKRKSLENKDKILEKEPVIPVSPKVQTTTVFQDEALKDKNVTWNIEPQPVVLPEGLTHATVQGLVNEKQEPVMSVVESIKTIEPIRIPASLEKKTETNQKNSLQKFLSLFLRKKIISTPTPSPSSVDIATTNVLRQAPVVPQQEVRGKTSAREFTNLFVWKNPVTPLELPPQTLDIKSDIIKEEQVVSKTEEPLVDVPKEILETPVFDNVIEAVSGIEQVEPIQSPSPVVPQASVNEVVVNKKIKLPKIVYKFINNINQFSRVVTKKIHQIESKANSKGNKNKPVWNPRPPVGKD